MFHTDTAFAHGLRRLLAELETRLALLMLVAAVAGLAGCTTTPPFGESVTLSVRSWDSETGSYELELRNHAARPILYLNPYLVFHTERNPDPAPFPYSPEVDGAVFMLHDTKLPPGEAVALAGRCTVAGVCAQQSMYVSVRVCWFNKAFTCEEYWPVWSDVPLNGF